MEASKNNVKEYIKIKTNQHFEEEFGDSIIFFKLENIEIPTSSSDNSADKKFIPSKSYFKIINTKVFFL